MYKRCVLPGLPGTAAGAGAGVVASAAEAQIGRGGTEDGHKVMGVCADGRKGREQESSTAETS
jgi:hypothetical protein